MPHPPVKPPAIYTPTQLNRLARDLVEGAFGAVTLEAEISGLTKASSGHYYFTLKDERAAIRGAMFKSAAARLKFEPKNGLKVQVRGRVSIYEATGSYQIVAEAMEMAGAGDLHAAFEALKAKLEAEGLFAAERKRPLPAMPHTLAVVTSATGAAVRDVLAVLQRRFPLLAVDIVPVTVQGEHAVPQIVRALQALDRAGDHDVVLLTRGGGSLEDLWAFNEEPVVRAVAAMSIPTVVAIGHETDFSLAEFAADLRAPTPSAAAEILAPEIADLGRQVTNLHDRFVNRFERAWQTRAQALDRLQLRLNALHPRNRLEQMEKAFATLQHRLRQAMQQRAIVAERSIAGMDRRLAIALQGRVERAQSRTAPLQMRMAQAMRARLESERMNVQGLGRTLASVNPLQTLERGYAVVRDMQGHVLQTAVPEQVGMELRINLRSGELRAQVTDALPETEPEPETET